MRNDLFRVEEWESTQELVLDGEPFRLFLKIADYTHGADLIIGFGLRDQSADNVLYYDAERIDPDLPLDTVTRGAFNQTWLTAVINNLEENYTLPHGLKVYLGLERPRPKPIAPAVQLALV